MAVRNGAPDPVLGMLYPFEDRYVRLSDGTAMHYIEAGSSGWRKPTFLLLHGNPTWSFLYRDWMAPLARIGRVVAVDHVGFGRSDHPRNPAYHRLERHIQNLEEFTAKLRLKRVVPVMQDWGGPIGLGYALRHTQDVSGLVLLNTWAFTQKVPLRLPWWYKALRTRHVGEYVYGRRNTTVDKFLPRLLAKPPSEAVLSGYRHPFSSPESRAALVGAPRMVPDHPDHPDWPALDRIEKSLGSLDMPAQVLWGAKDPVFPKRYAWAFAQALPRAEEPVFLENAGHWPQEDAAGEAVARVATFGRGL